MPGFRKKIVKASIDWLYQNTGWAISKVNENVRNDLSLYCKLYEREDVMKRRFYNIGAGKFVHAAWTNVDYSSEWYKENKIDINFDLMLNQALPVDDETANIVYSSHTIEHIPTNSAQNMFNESFRILRTGGILRLTTPNIDLDYRACTNEDKEYFYWMGEYSEPENMARAAIGRRMCDVSLKQVFLHHFASQVSELHANPTTNKISDVEFDEIFGAMEYEDALDFCVSRCSLELQRKYPGNHINWWNRRKLFRMLETAGFRKVWLSGYGQSFAAVLRNTFYFDNTHPRVSIYVEALKE